MPFSPQDAISLKRNPRISTLLGIKRLNAQLLINNEVTCANTIQVSKP